VTCAGRPVAVTHPEPEVIEFPAIAGAKYDLAAVRRD